MDEGAPQNNDKIMRVRFRGIGILGYPSSEMSHA